MTATQGSTSSLGALKGSSRNRGSARRLVDRRSVDRYEHVTVMQRSRLLVAATGAVAELGWDAASIGSITQRAGVSRRTFYELFENRDECLIAVLQSATARIAAQIAKANLSGSSWRERVRGGLWAILCFFDREPALARVCLVQSRRGEGIVLDYRQQIVRQLVGIVDQGREEPRALNATGLSAYGVVGGVLEVLYSRLLSEEGEPLRSLLGDLSAMVVLPYMGVAAAHRERSRPAPEPQPASQSDREGAGVEANGRGVLARLPMRLTYRTANVLQALEECPGQSNRQVANLAGIADQGQISKLMARLARLGLVSNHATVGERNQWVLTQAGTQVTRSIKSYMNQETDEATQEIKGGAHAQ